MKGSDLATKQIKQIFPLIIRRESHRLKAKAVRIIDTVGLWALFWQTGRPEVWLLLRQAERDERQSGAIPAMEECEPRSVQI